MICSAATTAKAPAGKNSEGKFNEEMETNLEMVLQFILEQNKPGFLINNSYSFFVTI